MREVHRLMAAITASAMAAICAMAQQHPSRPNEGTVKILFEAETDTGNIYNVFVENAPQSFNVPGAPRFAIMGKDHKFYLGITGFVKGTMSYDFGHPINDPNKFTTSAIPMHQQPGNGGLIQFSAAQSAIAFNMVALPGTDNQIGAYISANFLGGNYNFNLQYAYLKYRGILAGYNHSLFSDMASAPPTIDYEGAPSLAPIPNGVLNYTHGFNPHWSAGIGLEMPIASATTTTGSYTVNQRVPDIPAYVQYCWDNGGSWLRLSGIVRNMMYRDVVADRNRSLVGWGVKLSGSTTIAGPLRAYCQGTYGKGIASYFQDLYDGGLDMVPDASTAGQLSTVRAWGGLAGVQYTFSKNLFATVTYSQVRNYAPAYTGGTTAWSDQYRYGQYVVANVFYNIKSYLQWGIEYLWGKRSDMNGLSAHDNRLQTMLQISF